jgi:hypothetical protein
LNLQGLLLIFLQEWVDVESSREIEKVVNLLESLARFVIDDPIDLKEKSLWGLFDPAMFFDSNHLSLLVAIIIDVRYSDLLTGLVEFPMLDINK